MSLLYKVVLIGESDVGKSSLFIRFRDGKFIEHMKSTIGLDNATKEIKFTKSESDEMETTAKIQLWDTANFEASCSEYFYYRNCHGVILMYDVGDLESLHSCRMRLNEAKDIAPENAQFFLVGNKIDRSRHGDDVEVTMNHAMDFAEHSFIPKEHVFEISAKTEEGLDKMFVGIAMVMTDMWKTQRNNQIDRVKLTIYDTDNKTNGSFKQCDC